MNQPPITRIPRTSAPRQPSNPSRISTPLPLLPLLPVLRAPVQERSRHLLPIPQRQAFRPPDRSLPPVVLRPLAAAAPDGCGYATSLRPELLPHRVDLLRISGRLESVCRDRRTWCDSCSRCTFSRDLPFVTALLCEK